MNFLAIFLICLVGIFIIVMLGGWNGWLLLAGAALVLAVILNEYVKLEARVEELEKRLAKEEEDRNIKN